MPQIVKDTMVCVAGANSREYKVTNPASSPIYLVAFELEGAAPSGAPSWPFGNVYVYEPGTSRALALKAGWMEGGVLIWQGRIPLVQPWVIHAEVYHSRAGDIISFNYMLASAEEVSKF